MVSRGRRVVAIVGVVAMTGALGSCGNKHTRECTFVSGQYGVCTIDTQGSGRSADLGFHIDPDKSGNDFNDSYKFMGVEGDVASFSVMGEDFSCRQGETIPVGKGFVDCLEVEKDRLKVRIYVGNPPEEK